MTIQKIDLAPGEYLTEKQIKTYISNHDTTEFQTHAEYWKGKNTKIEGRKTDANYTSDDHVINNVIPVPHARKIAKTVVGYAFKPGSITYTSEDANYLDAIKEIFRKNDEEFKTAQNGLYMSSRGISYELQYTRKDPAGGAEYRFAKIEPDEVIPFESYDIEPELNCVIRYYGRFGTDDAGLNTEESIYIDVYYPDVIQYFTMKAGEVKKDRDEDFQHFMGAVPWVIYENNDELQPDYWAVKDLIDAYDVLMSDSMNEFEKFAYAYLRLVGFRLRDENKKTMKQLRAFEDLPEKDAVTYLTKDINTDFISFMTKLIEDLIFKYAHVYDPADEHFAGVASGVSLKYKLFDMETNLISFKESYHKKGLEKRLAFINTFLALKNVTTDEPIKIHYTRNTPNILAEIAEVVIKLSAVLSQETVLSLLPADIVQDVKEEIRRIEEEKEKKMQENLDILDEE
jgi:SPP1 family phage portal protein